MDLELAGRAGLGAYDGCLGPAGDPRLSTPMTDPAHLIPFYLFGRLTNQCRMLRAFRQA
jgi:hypothetical protein